MLPLTVVITCYRVAPYVGACLRSALEQDYEGPLEYLILDDASGDATFREIENAVASWGHGRDIRLFRHQENRGIAESMDEMMREARFDHLVWMDGDDIYAPDRCSVAASLFETYPDAQMLVASLMNADAAGRPLSLRGYAHNVPNDRLPATLALRRAEERIRGRMEDEGGVRVDGYGTGMCLNRALYRKWGPLTGDGFRLRCSQDAPWALRAYLSGTVVGDARIAGLYRSHDSNLYNRRCGLGLRGQMDYELFWTRNQQMPLATLRRHLLDVERALADPSLTDWPAKDLLRLKRYLETTLRGHVMRDCWWDVPWMERFRRTLRYRARVLTDLRNWPLGRLLPLSVFVWLKYGIVSRLKKTFSS